MNSSPVHIRELVGWDLDEYKYRPDVVARRKHREAAQLVAQRSPFAQSNIMVPTSDNSLKELLASQTTRSDLLYEMSGLSWSLGIADLRSLLAFQRRLSFRQPDSQSPIPTSRDWPALIDLCFGFPQKLECDLTHDRSSQTLIVKSSNPNLHIRTTNDPGSPLKIQSNGPFFEVACFRQRWFLRDGYHRAYALLRAGVFEVPAVIIHAASLEELGAVHPWFFPEELLFSEAPPQVVDFLNEDLVLEYKRPALIKTIRITVEETLAPASPTGDQQ